MAEKALISASIRVITSQNIHVAPFRGRLLSHPPFLFSLPTKTHTKTRPSFSVTREQGRDWGVLFILYLIVNAARAVGVALFFPVLSRGDYGACAMQYSF